MLRCTYHQLHRHMDIRPKRVKKRVKFGLKNVHGVKKSSGPICRYYMAILISSIRDTFLPKFWGKKRVKFGEKNVHGVKNIIRSYM